MLLQLATRIQEHLGVLGPSDRFADQIARVWQDAACEEWAFHEHVVVAWGITQRKQQQGLIDHSPLAYLLGVLRERLTRPARPARVRRAGMPQRPMFGSLNAPAPAQDPAFLKQVRSRLGDVGDQELWVRALEEIRGIVTAGNFGQWFTRTVLLSAPDVLTVVTDTQFQQQWLQRNSEHVVRPHVPDDQRRPLRYVMIQDILDERRGRPAALQLAQETAGHDSATQDSSHWDAIKQKLATTLAPTVYKTRVANTYQLASDDPPTIVVHCPDAATCQWLERQLGRQIAEIAARLAGEPRPVRFVNGA